MSHQNPYADTLNPKVMVLRGMVFGRWVDHEGGALMNGISALIKKEKSATQERSLTWSCQHPGLVFPASRTVKRKFMLFIKYHKPWYLAIAAQTDWQHPIFVEHLLCARYCSVRGSSRIRTSNSTSCGPVSLASRWDTNEDYEEASGLVISCCVIDYLKTLWFKCVWSIS